MARSLAATCCIAVLLWSRALPLYAGDLLQLTVVEGPPPASGVRTFATREVTTLRVQSGQQVALQRTRGKDYLLQGTELGWALTSIEQVPAAATAIAMTPTVTGAEVTLEVDYRSYDAGGSTTYVTTVRGALDDWLTLFGTTPQPDAAQDRSYRTGKAREALSVRVERIP